ncbi:MAG TPA: hypothetical protein VNH45_12480 [Gaiellaceae bacterium]|nr:hypothetical protein [Gaiellaceae bacterium]
MERALFQVLVGAGGDRVVGGAIEAATAHDQDADAAVQPAEPFCRLDPVRAGQADVDERDVDVLEHRVLARLGR